MKHTRCVLCLILPIILLWSNNIALATADTLTLPSSLRSIEEEAFQGDTTIDKVVVPEGLTSIGERAFADSSLKEINLPNSLVDIADDALPDSGDVLVTANKGTHAYDWAVEKGYIYTDVPFKYTIHDGKCRIDAYIGSETTIDIPETIGNCPVTELGAYTFYGCNDVTHVTIPNSVTIIEDHAFSYCSGLTSIRIPDGVKSIGEETFNFCVSLTAIWIPNGVTYIGKRAFAGSGLVSVSLPASLQNIANDAFEDSALTHIYTEKGTYAYEWMMRNGYMPMSDFQLSRDGIYSYLGNGGNVIIPSRDKDGRSIAFIGRESFSGKSNITSITIPDSITYIREYAFSGCSSLTSITLPDSLEWIWDYAFSGCNSLTSITIPNSVTTIGKWAFAGCNNLKKITLSNNLTGISEYMFNRCESMTSITIPNSVTYIGHRAFWECHNLTSITIPNSVTSIYMQAFWDCNSLTSVTIPNSMIDIGRFAFCNCENLTSISIPSSVTSIGEYAFSGCDKLTIYGTSGSYVEGWAKENGIAFSTGTMPESTATLSGSVTTENGVGIEGVTVKLYLDGYTSGTPIITTTDINGIWRYAMAKSGHNYMVTFAHDAYRFSMDSVLIFVQATNTSVRSIIAYTDYTPTILLSGRIIDSEDHGIKDVDVTIVDEDNSTIIGSTITVSNGKWKAQIPNISSNVKVFFHSSNYSVDPASMTVMANQNTTLENVIATMISSNIGEVSFAITNINDSIVVGDIALFEVNASGEKVRLIVDGTIYEEYLLSSGSTVVRRVFSKAGDRQVQFQVYDKGKWGVVSACQVLHVTSNGKLDAPTFEMGETHVLGSPLSIEWASVDNASYYVVYLYTPTGIGGPYRIEANAENNLTYTIDGSMLESSGQHGIEVIACGYGYSQSSFSKLFEVEPVTPSLVIVNPKTGYAFDEGNQFEFRVNNPNQRYMKLKITKLSDGSSKYYPTTGLVNDSEYVILDTFASSGDYKFEVFGFVSDNDLGENYAPDAPLPVTISVSPSSFTDVSIGNGKGNQLITTNGLISFTAKGNTSIVKVEVYEGETLLKTVEDYTVEKTGKWKNVFSDSISVTTEGKHHIRFVATDTNNVTHERMFTYYAITAISNGDTLYPIEGRDDLYLRTYPDAENRSITNGKIDADGSVKIIGSFGDSYYVQYNGKYGYVYKKGDVYQYSQITRQSAKPGIYAHGSFLGEPYIHSYSANEANRAIWSCEFQWGQIPTGAYAISGFLPNDVSIRDEIPYLTARNELDGMAMIDVSCKNSDCVFTGNSKDYRAVIRVYCREGYLLARSIAVVTIYANEKEYKYQTNQQIPTENMEYVSSLITDSTLRAHFDSWRNANNNPYNEGYLLQEFTYDAMQNNGLNENSLAWKAKDALWGLSSLGLSTIWGWIKDYISGNKNVREYKTLLDNVYLEYVQTVLNKSSNFLKDWKDVKGVYDELYDFCKSSIDNLNQEELDTLVGEKDFITVKDWLELSDYAKSKGVKQFTPSAEKLDRDIRSARAMGRINGAGQIIYKGINLVIDAHNFSADKTLFLIELAQAPDEFIASLQSIRSNTTDTDLKNAINSFLSAYKEAVKGSIESFVTTCLIADKWDTIANIGISITNYISGFTDKVGKINTSAGSILDKVFGKALKSGNAFSSAQSIMGTTVFFTDLILDTTEIQNVTFKVSKSYQYKQALNVTITNDLATYSNSPSQELADRIVAEINMLKASMIVGENYARDMYFQVIDSNYARAKLNDASIIQSYGVAGAWMGVDKRLSEQTKEWYDKQKKGFEDIVGVNRRIIENFYVPK